MTVSVLTAVWLLLSGSGGELVYDTGDPMPRDDGDIPYMSVWRVLDPLDNLCVRVIVPIELDQPTRVTKLAFYSFNPKDPAAKLVDIYRGTNEESAGTLAHRLVFEDHEGVREGWNEFPLEAPLFLPAGRYGIAFHGRFEFHSYWAMNTPNGAGFAWARGNDDMPWFLGREADFGVEPNFGVRVYGLQPKVVRPAGAQRGGLDQPAGPAEPSSPPGSGDDPLPGVPIDTDGPEEPGGHEYEPGTAEETFRVIWRPAIRNEPVAPARR